MLNHTCINEGNSSNINTNIDDMIIKYYRINTGYNKDPCAFIKEKIIYVFRCISVQFQGRNLEGHK